MRAASSVLACAALLLTQGAGFADNRTLTDQNGRNLSVPEKVDRIASLVIPGASMVLTLDRGSDRLVGIHPTVRDDIKHGLLADLFPAIRDVPANMAGDGFAPNTEALLNARPDLVLQWGDKGENIIRPIETMGLTVLTLKYGQTDYVATWLRLIGQASGRAERAEALASWIERERDALRAQFAALPENERPRVLYLYRYHGGLQVAGAGTNMDFDIQLAGGVNVAAKTRGNAAVSREQIIAWNPDVILLSNFDAQLTPDDLRKDPILSATRAVRDNRLYKLPRGVFRWDPPSQETPLAWRWLAGMLHPRLYPLNGFRAQLRDTYTELYGQPASEADIDRILHVALNASSSGYAALQGAAQ